MLTLRFYAGLLFFLCLCTAARAYEDDVHYGLTKWLALEAGFPASEAETIAREDVDVDGTATGAVRLVAFYACMGSNKPGAELVRENHFPSTGAIPSPPTHREVLKNSQVARRIVDDIIARPLLGTSDEKRYSLERLGIGLHRLQDSYSHQGVPDVPQFGMFKCNDGYAWAHPATRTNPVSKSGWNKHDADITSLFPDDADQMAAVTFEVLCNFRLAEHSPCKVGWPALSRIVQEFNRANTKSQKWLWFQRRKQSARFSCEFLAHINVKDGIQWICAKTKNAIASERQLSSSATTDERPSIQAEQSATPQAFVESALETWFVKADPIALATYYVDTDSYAVKLKGNAIADSTDPTLTVAKYFAVALLDTVPLGTSVFGDASVAGAFTVAHTYGGNGESFTTLTIPRPEEKNGDTWPSFQKYESLSSAFLPIGEKGEPFEIIQPRCTKAENEPCFAAVAVIRDHPTDYLILELQKIGHDWRIVGHDFLVPH